MDEQHVGHSDSETGLCYSECKGNKIHAWKTYMEMKGFLSGFKSGELWSQSFAWNAEPALQIQMHHERPEFHMGCIFFANLFTAFNFLFDFQFVTHLVSVYQISHCCRMRTEISHIIGKLCSVIVLFSSHAKNILSLHDLRFAFRGKTKHKFVILCWLKCQQHASNI